MARTVLTDDMWEQLLGIMENKGCYDTRNSRNIMEAIIWKLRTGSPWEDVPKELCPWKTAYNRFNRWSKQGLWEGFFLTYEAKLMRSGYSETEVTSALISIRAELGVENIERLVSPEEGQRLRSTWPPMRMEIRSILKSLGVKFTTVKLRKNS